MQSITLFPVHLVQCIFLFQMLFGALLINSQKQSRSLVLLFAFQGCVCAFNLLEGLGFSSYLITPAFTLLYGPMIYFFTLSITGKQPFKTSHYAVHLIPAAISLAFTHYTQAIILLGSLSQLGYFYFAYCILKRYHKQLMHARSDAESLKLKWLIKALFIFAIIVIFDLLRMNAQPITPLDLKMHWYLLNEILLLLMFSFLLFHTIKNSFQFEPVTLSEEPEAEQTDSSDEQLAQQIFSTIDDLIINESLYRQPRLSLNDLANQTGLGSKEISWAINSTTGNNFCEYINQHRVNDVKREIEQDSPQKLSLIELAFQAGFNSKSTFNAVFKKETGLTPSQFKKQTQNN
ncbi:helix-turn-helix domain-containing protein [Pseudoalteromonas sp. CH_XMU1449-3]|uniref:helix-turn-helix domain-containing protein n=1 Tax=Pseudoalteromonas sp. CH_XMU1449-3 TaxID=3107774 RepID=UPI00300A8B57